MSRAERLLALLQILHHHRQPVSGAELARTLGVSQRTLYRDIASLQAQGAAIRGEPGVGYLLTPGFLLPPMMFSRGELEALLLGTRWVAAHTDHELADYAQQALGKIAGVLPPKLRPELDADSLRVPARTHAGREHLPLLRQAIREERKIAIAYRDQRGRMSRRIIWPFALGFFERMRIVAAWCERRRQFRHFQVERLVSAELLPERYPSRRAQLRKQWQALGGNRVPSGH